MHEVEGETLRQTALVAGLVLVALIVLAVWPRAGQPLALRAQTTRTPLPTFTPRSPAAPAPTADAVVAEQRTVVAATNRAAAVPALPTSIKGLPLSEIVVMPEATRLNVHTIFARGQALGRNARAFAKVGDSTMVWPAFLAAFDDARGYTLGPFAGLQTTIAHYAGSFGRTSIAVQIGMHTWTEFDAAWAGVGACLSGEGPLACELRLHNPSVAIIRLGTNDALDAPVFETQMRRVIEYCLANGVIAVLGTKPDRIEGPDNTINKIIVKLADTYHLPLWDYDLIAGTVPGKGLQEDKIHFLAGGPHDYSSAATFGHADSLEDISALVVLEMIRSEVQK